MYINILINTSLLIKKRIFMLSLDKLANPEEKRFLKV